MTQRDLATALSVTDALLKDATKEDVSEALRIASLMIAEHERGHGEIPMERLNKVLNINTIDDDTEDLLIMGLTNLAGLLGTVMRTNIDDEAVH
jgi:hypothetical protein